MLQRAWAQPCGCEAAWQEKQQQQEAGEGQSVPVALLGLPAPGHSRVGITQCLVRRVLRQVGFEGNSSVSQTLAVDRDLSWMPLRWRHLDPTRTRFGNFVSLCLISLAAS